MRRQAFIRRKRNDLAWFACGLLAVQLALGAAVDQLWPAIRDPEYDEIERIVCARRAEAPTRPLVLALGSSRTRLGLDAEQLSQMRGSDGPLVINCGLHAAGPILSQVVLRRLLDAGLRPDLVMLEVIPMSLSARSGAHNEELWKFPLRLNAEEAAGAWSYYDQPHRLVCNWGVARLFPCYRHRAELRNALGFDSPAASVPVRAR